MDNFLSVKTNWRHCTLEYLIKILDSSPDTSRSAIFEREVRAAQGVDNWKEIQEKLLNLEKQEAAALFTGMQVKYSEEISCILEEVKEDIRNQCNLHILQTQYMVQLLHRNYLETLEQKRLFLKTESRENASDNISLPEMLKIFAEMMLKDKDCDALKQIRKILVDWRNDQ